jgi:hypothetical protein
MSLTTNAKNTMLDALTPDTMSLHSGFPGLTGANELTGGSPAYARKACTFGAATGGVRSTTATVTFDVGAGSTVRWVGLWVGSTYVGWGANGGTAKEFLAQPATDLILSTAHGYSDGQTIVFYNGTVPAPLVEGTVYFVRDAATDSFKLAATAGGAVIDLTTAGSTDCVMSSIQQDAYASQGTHSITSASVGLPF